jgi:hypothetical protein
MRKVIPLLVITAVALGGCAMFKGKSKPLDEFAVARNAPLIIPPDFTLNPPAPGAISGSAGDSQSQAINTVFGGPAPRSAGESAMLQSAGRDQATLGARSVAGDPSTNVVDKGVVTQAVIAAPAGDGQAATAEVPQATAPQQH